MNHTTNDKGETVIAVGAPCSIERVKVEYPKLIEQLNALYYAAFEDYGKGIDKAIELIREAGVKGALETESLLKASHYGEAL